MKTEDRRSKIEERDLRPIELAKILLARIDQSLEKMLIENLASRNGLLVHSAVAFVLGRIIKLNGRIGLHVNIAVGSLADLKRYMPKGMEFISFTRPKHSMELRQYRAKRFVQLAGKVKP